MREECKHYESRTYPSGDTVRKCNLDLAPDAPWRCPADCAAYERRMLDASWDPGSLHATPAPPEPAGLDDGSAAAILDEAEAVLNAAGIDILTELSDATRKRPSRWRRLFRRRDSD